MLSAPDAMAMFMLRLSGLLSLEKSFHNDTSSHPFGVSTSNSSFWSFLHVGDTFNDSTDYNSLAPTYDDTVSILDEERSDGHTTERLLLIPIASPLVSGIQQNDTNERQTQEIRNFNNSFEDIPNKYQPDKQRNVEERLNTTGVIMPNFVNTSLSKLAPDLIRTNNNSEQKINIQKGYISETPNEINVNNTTDTNNRKTLVNGNNNNSESLFSTPKFLMEELLEDDDLLNIIEEGSGMLESKEPPSEFITPQFEYYDLSAENENIYNPPNLTSHSLVSPIPYPRPSLQTSISSTRATVGHVGSNDRSQVQNPPQDTNETFDQSNDPERRTEEVRRNKVIKPVMIHPSSPHRNNPYPYGPMFLPGYTSISSSSNVPRRKGSVEPNTILISSTTSTTTNSPTTTTARTTTTTPQPTSEDYEYEYDVYEYQEEERKVQTIKPPVLFYFNGPGYSPEPPSTIAPPVRMPTPSDPWDCSPRCPNYTLEDWNPHYDIRQYPKMTWLSTIIIGQDRVLAELEGYMRLQDYFYGLNDRGQLLNLSVPFLTQMKQSRHPGILHELNDFAISLHVPPESLEPGTDLPAPLSNQVLIDTLDAKTVFVSNFEVDVWEVTGEFLERRAEALMARLRANGESFMDRYYYLASYSRPELYQPVYYELWVYATSLRRPRPLPLEPLSRPRMAPLSRLTNDTMQRLCRGVECPSFEVVRSYRYGIQKRRYFDVVFASVSPGDCFFSTLSVWRGFMPLHLYKHGINSQMQVVEATRPIAVVRVKEDSTPNTECPQNLTMSFFLPRRLHSAPPTTGFTAPGPVVISTMDHAMVYTYTVGGYLLEPNRVRKELSDFRYRLEEFGACYRDDLYYIVVYDFIARYHGRQNEIWIVAENCRATRNG